MFLVLAWLGLLPVSDAGCPEGLTPKQSTDRSRFTGRASRSSGSGQGPEQRALGSCAIGETRKRSLATVVCLFLGSTGREFLHIPLPHPLLRLGRQGSLTGLWVLRKERAVGGQE